MDHNYIVDALLGAAVGDALGVPFEFRGRSWFIDNPVTDMEGHGTHRMPPGTWSDDTSLTLCLAKSLVSGYNVDDIGANFLGWMNYNQWTATGVVFDIGIATRIALRNIQKGISPMLSGGMEENSNGNGSLMRILPLVFYTKDKPIAERYKYVKEVSGITHAHIRSVIACFYYTEFALQVINGATPMEAYTANKKIVTEFLISQSINNDEIEKYRRLLQGDIYFTQQNFIMSSGYVLHTLEAAMWCLLTTDNYKDAVLKAVNLGEDTDTTAAVTGGLAGLVYGANSIPSEWVQVLARKNDITDLANSLYNVYK